MNEQELNKKLAKWAGFRPATQQEYSRGSIPQPDMDKRGWGYLYPNGEIKWYLPNFTQSLDACFKWLVPKLRELGLLLELNDMKTDWHWDIWKPVGTGKILACDDDENPALALCLTIEKLIDGKEAKNNGM